MYLICIFLWSGAPSGGIVPSSGRDPFPLPNVLANCFLNLHIYCASTVVLAFFCHKKTRPAKRAGRVRKVAVESEGAFVWLYRDFLIDPRGHEGIVLGPGLRGFQGFEFGDNR